MGAHGVEADPLTDLDGTIRKRIVSIEGGGVWYQSGRMLFPTWDDDADA